MLNDRRPNTAILLAAGRGKRLLPYTDDTPKPLLLFKNRPIVDYILDALKFANIKNIYIVTNYLEEKIILHVNKKYGQQFNITFCHQNNILGSANAVLSTSKYVKRELFSKRPLIISATDYIMPIGYIRDLIQYHINNTSDITISLRKVSKDKIKNSSLAIKNNADNLIKIIEKPENNCKEPLLAASLLYIVPTQIFNYLNETTLSKRGEYELPDVVNMMINDGTCAKGFLQSKLIDLEDIVKPIV